MGLKIIDRLKRTSIKKESILPFLILILTLGMVYGIISVNGETTEKISNIALNYIKLQRTEGIILTFSKNLFSAIAFLLSIYWLGYNAIGQPFTAFVLFFKGLGLSSLIGALYLVNGLQGVFYCIIIILPHTIIEVYCILIMSRESLKLSNIFLGSITNKKPTISTIKLYNLKFIILIAFTFVASIVYALCVYLFSNLIR